MSKRQIVVTGTAGFLGTVVSALLADRGFAVVGLDLAGSGPSADRMARFIAGIDLTDEAEADRWTAVSGEAPIAGLVNIVDGFAWETVSDDAVATWHRLYAMNVRTALIASRALLPALRAGNGAIVDVSADGSIKADVGIRTDAATKSSVSRLTEAPAADLKDEGVRVNAVLPSIIDTPANRADMPGMDTSRWGKPDALAEVIAFLLSDAARAVTGALLPVAGRV